MEREPDIKFERSPLVPVSWGVECPACGDTMIIDDTHIRQHDDGSWFADGVEGFPECANCGAGIEVRAVYVQEVEDD